MILTENRSSQVAERIRTAVEDALAARNLSARRASIDVVGHDGLIRDIRAGRLPSIDRIEALFDYLGLETYFGPSRKQKRPELFVVESNHDPDAVPLPGFLPIPWIELGHQPGSAPVAFSRTWLTQHQLVPDFLQAARPDVVGLDQPGFADALALVDTRDAHRRGHGLWCFRDGGKVQVAHLTFQGEMTVVHPARAEAPARVFARQSDGPARLYGKVVWLGQSIPFMGKVE